MRFRRKPRRPIEVPTLTPALDVDARLTDLQREVAGRVTELAGSGSVDAGNGDVLDAWLERQRASWRARLTAESTTALAAVQARIGEYESRLRDAELESTAVDVEVADTERAIGELADDIYRAGGGNDRERRRRPRPTSDPLEGITVSWWSRGILWLLLLLAATGDVVTFNLVLKGAFRDASDWVAGGLTAAFAAAAVGLMHVVGRALKNLREGQGGLGRPTIVLIVLGWLALGGVAVFFRSQVATPTTAAGSIFASETGAEAAAAQEQLLSAVLLAGLFVASGLLAFYVGYSEHHPRMSSYRSLQKRLGKQQTRQRAAASDLVRAREALALARTAEAHGAVWLTERIGQVDSTVDELKELVRVLVAQHMGLPEATNGLTTGRVRPDVDFVPASALNGHGSPNGHGTAMPGKGTA